MTHLKALLFDVDGTLVESEELHRVAFNDTFAANGLHWHWDQALYKALLRTGGGKERIAAYAKSEGIQALEPERIVALHKDKTARYQNAIAEGRLPLRPGIASLIDEGYGAGLKLGIVTTTSRSNVVAIIEANLGEGSLEKFAVIAAGEDAARKKPDPQLYEIALDKLALPATSCLAIEDSYNGIQSSLAAGVPTFITRTFWTAEDDFSGALAVRDSLDVDLAFLRELHGRASYQDT